MKRFLPSQQSDAVDVLRFKGQQAPPGGEETLRQTNTRAFKAAKQKNVYRYEEKKQK